jgi:hypothetical protein
VTGWSVVISAVVGLVSGAIGSLIAPWVHHAIEKDRESRAHHRALIAKWRAMVGRYRAGGLWVINDPDYTDLRGYLGAEALHELERNSHTITIVEGTEGISADHRLKVVVDEIARLERAWGLD